MLCAAGIDRMVTLDLHSGQIQGFFDVPVDNLYANPVFAQDIMRRFNGDRPLIVSPDVGGVVRARGLAERLSAEIAIIDKRRPRANETEVLNVIGDCKDRHCVLIDDIADTAGTLCSAARALMERGAKSVCAYVSHGVFSGSARQRIAESDLQAVVATDSIPANQDNEAGNKIGILSVAELFGEAIVRICANRSVSSLFR
jgi:ribose-phosphate pyrophosphokinase